MKVEKMSTEALHAIADSMSDGAAAGVITRLWDTELILDEKQTAIVKEGFKFAMYMLLDVLKNVKGGDVYGETLERISEIDAALDEGDMNDERKNE